MILVSFIAGMFVGVIIGFTICSALCMASIEDEKEEKMNANNIKEKKDGR